MAKKKTKKKTRKSKPAGVTADDDAATERKPYRIMSFDGGGIRGVITAVWLARLERELGGRIRDHVDLLAGTSTGSILACALALGIPAEQIVKLYRDKGQTVFPGAGSRLWSRASRLFSQGASAPKYDGDGLEEVLKAEFGASTRFSKLGVKTLVTTYDTLTRQAIVMKSHREEYAELPVWKVVKASSSAPTYFPAQVMTVHEANRSLIDGGVVANNPTACAVAEGLREKVAPDQFHVASFGTGSLTRPISIEEATGWGALEWAVPIIDVLFDGAADAVDYIVRYLVPKSQYVRLQTNLSSGFDDMDDASRTNINALMALAEHYLDNDGRDALDKAVRLFE